MLSKANSSINTAIATLTEFEISATFFAPTHTALAKSIVDAHESFRVFLQREGVHDYSTQGQGPHAKVMLPITLLSKGRVVEAEVSLYRPETKTGDPRFWITHLRDLSQPSDLWALWLSHAKGLVAVNCSYDKFSQDALDTSTELGSLLKAEKESRRRPQADELLSLLGDINRRGWIQTMRSGDTGVGFTLESLLGISANSSKTPDFKGIEIKAKRPNLGNRVNFFSQVPDWKSSACKSGLEILEKYGYEDTVRGRKALYVTVASTPNSQGILFTRDIDPDWLLASRSQPDLVQEIVRWNLGLLEKRLEEKHAETFWVSASSRSSGSGIEEFWYKKVTHTKSPIVEYFGPLVESGVITMDFTLHMKPNGQARDHGYLFKIKPTDLDLIFPPATHYELSEW